jgi:peptide/nickel transport system substrate-binding protein
VNLQPSDPHGLKNVAPKNNLKSLIVKLDGIVSSLSLTGKTILAILVIAFCSSSLYMLYKVNESFLVVVPLRGGTIREGESGEPQFINPVLATSDTDKDIAALVYSGLMRRGSDGTLIPDLAESYTISPDGKTYTFTLKKNATFQDGKPVTADDVVFTIQTIQNPAIDSPHYADWAGIQVTKIDADTVQFVLPNPYGAFLENTTIGILPEHLWVGISPDKFSLAALNGDPVGSGPYQISGIDKDSDSVPTSYSLAPFAKFALGEPFISNLTFVFYKNTEDLIDAFNQGGVDSIDGISPENVADLKAGTQFTPLPLPRSFALFLNQQQNPVLADASVRQALDMSVDRDYIVNTVLQGFASPLYGPMPAAFLKASTGATTTDSQENIEDGIARANALLNKDGWTLNSNDIRQMKMKNGTTTTLSFSISTTDAPELREIAETLQKEWAEIGANVSIKVFESGYLDQNVIKPRSYDSLLFGEVVNPGFDLYPFWASSETTDPGLNIALYSNKDADRLLAQMRATTSQSIQESDYAAFQADLQNDLPAIFLYSPDLIYVAPKQAKGIAAGPIIDPSDRFANIYEWYTETESIWRIFLHNQ